ncbi:MAG: NAD-dependent epimerase/dehydratase family protein [Anaerolineae bacterium]|nr:NAD-dependent epimerase/dehydratase family protein [Anaerolineae bacterium]MCO5189640.1 NAD-dependent epimerase/dehydratase family protein [Anaerolineae bacterium]MCO5192989.1 NAD-dependent epimerase/dehydratase family protein [Anaerolineae bacterium]MCO5199720.1 NAD-dependent epimerase/dehydratase family protein [Anaerolineae bacterium]MCO5205965.1 NAD-dependent epimerase/dehydratase family protein [Anaerolineae bacterium]
MSQDKVKQHILVTGASGFTGGHLCRRLLANGHHVRVLARPNSDLSGLSGDNLEIHIGDLSRPLPDQLLDGIDTVYHIAAAFRTEVSTQYFYDTNVGGTERLLELAARAGIGRFVHCSTVGVLGDIKNPPADETAPYNPGDDYQASKAVAERNALEFSQKRGLPLSVVRPGGIYGPGDMRFLKVYRAINRGAFWLIGDGNVQYTFIHIDDLVDGFLLAGQLDQAIDEIFILTGAEIVTIRKWIELVAAALGKPPPRRQVPLLPVKIAAHVSKAVCTPLGVKPPLYPRRLDFFTKDRAFDIGKANRVLGFRPKIDLATGVKQTADWYRTNNYL